MSKTGEENSGGPVTAPDSGTAPGQATTLDAAAAAQQEVLRLRSELADTRQALAEAERLADQDPLAPVANRRAFMRELGRVVAFARRHQLPASLVYLDINGFKQINESLGHAGGDAALRHVAALLLANVRESDVVGRLGGDEFGVILSGTGLAAAVEKADQLRQLICAQSFTWQGRAVSLGIAAGVADLLAEETPEQAINAADHAMFVDKRRQRGATEQEAPQS